MKELSIEEKAKRYDNLLVKLQEAKVDNKVCDERYCCVINDIVPELIESEDEKIRTEIKNIITYFYGSTNLFVHLHSKEELLAWLEKQGEQKPYGLRQECTDYQFNYAGECKGYCAMKRGEQKSWSEEDEGKLKSVISLMKSNRSADPFYDKMYLENWLQSLKDRVGCETNCTTTKDWSEEDIVMHNDCICAINAASEADYTPEEKEKLTNWLRNIRPKKQQEHIESNWLDEANNDEELLIAIDALEKAGQHDSALWVKHLADSYPQSHWKPSDEQMLAINTAINVLGKGTINGKYLMELQEQLKKLKG